MPIIGFWIAASSSPIARMKARRPLYAEVPMCYAAGENKAREMRIAIIVGRWPATSSHASPYRTRSPPRR